MQTINGETGILSQDLESHITRVYLVTDFSAVLCKRSFCWERCFPPGAGRSASAPTLLLLLSHSFSAVRMAGYDDQATEEYYLEEPAGSFEQDLVYALDPEPSRSGGSQPRRQGHNPHSADFESLIRAMAKEHDYNASSHKAKTGEDLVSSSSDLSSETGDDPPRKRKKAAHHQEDPLWAPKDFTFQPEDIIHPRSASWVPPVEVLDYVESQIRHSFDKEVRSRLRTECPRLDFPSKVTETPELDPSWSHF
ncbi:hypothetical protein NDU88_009461 [Pleurodeles waltl]|uniref:Uncharacterized protein n=1 Tax=Pleurodeles waltl TaxID=8319 RepID=A0AAV7QXM3_PLEWA|nr:hypothetical protein NDU88_009461 [Pleurodeles waltl]